MKHIAFFTVYVMAYDKAPSLTWPVLVAWVLFTLLDWRIARPTDGDAGKLAGQWLLIILVGLGALALVVVGGAAMEGRL
jgi:hypothetical protein